MAKNYIGRGLTRLAYLDTFRLDLRLALRVLRKSWGLTLFGGLAMAIGITFGASFFELLHVAGTTSVPLDEGERVVVIQPFDLRTRQQQPASADDFERWRSALRSVQDVGAFRTLERDLITANGTAPPVRVAEMTASGFRLARVPALLGRFLSAEDETPGAPPVVVIGYDAWQSTFAGDVGVVGRTVQLDGVFHTVVGVMPQGFAFPVSHEYWTPLRADAAEGVVVFARLAPGARLEGAHAEVETLGLAAANPPQEADAPLRPRVVPYVIGITGELPGIVALLPLILPLLLVLPCANIGILVYARTMAREGELAARTALGATRSRIVVQIFIEALVLAVLATGMALALTPKLVDFLRTSATPGVRMPFWLDFGLSYATIGYSGALAIVAAAIAGAIPALRATGRLNLACLHALGARSAPKLGKVWTALVLLQVALSVAILPAGSEIALAVSGASVTDLRFAPDEYLTARLSVDPDADLDTARFANIRDELVQQLKAEPGVTNVTLAEAMPSGEAELRVEVEETSSFATTAFNRVDLEYFPTFRTRVLTGRGFEAGDFDTDRNTIVVNRSFARRVLGDGNPLGRRVRVAASGEDEDAAAAAGPWLEVVGVVEDFSANGGRRAFYQPLPRIPETALAPSDPGAPAQRLAIHAGATVPAELASRLRAIAASLDPDLRIDPLLTMDVTYETFWLEDGPLASALAGLLFGIVLFSVAGIYTLMAFTVVQRRREIAIRSALGATPGRLIAGIFWRVLVPVSIGVALGGLGAVLIEHYFAPLLFEFREGGRPLPWALPAAEALLMAIGIVVAAGPARRALRVDPVVDLREG